jgi:hypothetical protein
MMSRALLLLCFAWGCISAPDTARRGLLGDCAFSDDCASPLICAAARCRAPCRSDRDCANRGRCLSAGTVDGLVCYAPDDYANACVWDSHCRGGRVCGGDRVCRVQCRADYDCAVLAPGLRCLASGVCSAHPFLDDAGALRDVDLNVRDGRATAPAPTDTGAPVDAIPLGDSGFGAVGDEPTAVATTGCGPSSDARSCTPGAPGCEVAALVATGVSDSRCVRFVDGSVRCWGSGRNGVLGIGPYPAQCFSPFVAQRLHGASSLALGGASGCALFRRGVWCWGSNLDGSVGNGATAPALVPTAIGEAPMGDGTLVAGLGRTVCHLAPDGALRCWGQNASGQLAQGDVTARTRAVTVPLTEVTDVGLGTSHACAVRRDGSVWCWGTNCGGECGREPAVAPGGLYRDPCVDLVTSPLRVPGITDAREVAVGPHVSCARRATGEVVCWGWNGSGELGRGDAGGYAASPAPVVGLGDVISLGANVINGAACALRGDRTVWCWGIGGRGHAVTDHRTEAGRVTMVPGMTGVRALSRVGACALRDDGVWCWAGLPGDGASAYRVEPSRVGL